MEMNEENIQNQKLKNKRTNIIIAIIIVLLIIGIIYRVVVFVIDIVTVRSEIEKIVKESYDYIHKEIENEKQKPTIHDAEYLRNKTEKKLTVNNKTYSTNTFNIPYINLNSMEAKLANQEIQQKFLEQYELFGKKDDDTTYITSIDYLYSYTETDISLLILYDTFSNNSKIKQTYLKSYNLKIDSKKNNQEDSAEKYSKELLHAMISNYVEKENSNGNKLQSVDGEYFIYNNKLYAICTKEGTSSKEKDSKQYTLYDCTDKKETSFSQIKEKTKKDQTLQDQTISNSASNTAKSNNE